jgi:hypothetical protein
VLKRHALSLSARIAALSSTAGVDSTGEDVRRILASGFTQIEPKALPFRHGDISEN